MLLPVAVCLAVYSYEKPITDPTVMANIEALTDIDTGNNVWAAISRPDGDNCSVYVNDILKFGKKTKCYSADVQQYCASGICSVMVK